MSLNIDANKPNNSPFFNHSIRDALLINEPVLHKGKLKVGLQGIRQAEEVQRTGKGDQKLQRIINKFKAGKKLTPEEMSYLAEKAPEIYQEAVRIAREREALEARLQAAKTQMEMDQVAIEAMEQAKKLGGTDFEKTARCNQYMDAIVKARKQGKKTEDDEILRTTADRQDQGGEGRLIKGGEEKDEEERRGQDQRRRQDQPPREGLDVSV